MGWDKVAVVGAGMIKFGELFEQSYEQMAQGAFRAAIASAVSYTHLPAEAKCIACCDEPHCRSTDVYKRQGTWFEKATTSDVSEAMSSWSSVPASPARRSL